MERLTEKCWRNLDPWECCGQDHYCKRGCHELGGCTNGCIVPKVYCRLATYEDTGLTPEEISRLKAELDFDQMRRLKALLQAEKDGRLVVLPCKVGNTVYFPVESRWDNATIEHIEIWPGGVRFYWVQYDVGPETNELWDEGSFKLDDIGKTVFLTLQEAEEALRKEKEHGTTQT